MSALAPEQRRFRERALRAARELEKERATYGAVRDGSGKRYRVGMYFLLSGDVARAADAFDWFEREFPGDAGEPVFHLYGALAARRHGEPAKARRRLLAAQASNIYLLPFACGQEVREAPIWHPSAHADTEYLLERDEFLDELNDEELGWIASALETPAFIELKQGYIATYGALLGEQDMPTRVALLDAWQALQDKLLAQG